MDFLSDDGGRTYSLCHCGYKCLSPGDILMIPNPTQSGAISKSLI
jgi:hypothetical protein